MCLIRQMDSVRDAVAGTVFLEALAFWIAFQITPPQLTPMIVAAVLTSAAGSAGIITGIRTRRAERPRPIARTRLIELDGIRPVRHRSGRDTRLLSARLPREEDDLAAATRWVRQAGLMARGPR